MLGRMRLPADRRVRRAAQAVVVASLVGMVATGCKSDQEKYCDAVKGHQQELGEVIGDGSPDALLKALPIFQDLSEDSPEDIRDDWKVVIDALEGLQDALQHAGVDPSTYDRDHPPAGLGQDDKDAIDGAAAALGSEATTNAFNAVEQEAKDVCGTPLEIG
jgi:hypothetical protein